jgi:hypothetical protein
MMNLIELGQKTMQLVCQPWVRQQTTLIEAVAS